MDSELWLRKQETTPLSLLIKSCKRKLLRTRLFSLRNIFGVEFSSLKQSFRVTVFAHCLAYVSGLTYMLITAPTRNFDLKVLRSTCAPGRLVRRLDLYASSTYTTQSSVNKFKHWRNKGRIF